MNPACLCVREGERVKGEDVERVKRRRGMNGCGRVEVFCYTKPRVTGICGTKGACSRLSSMQSIASVNVLVARQQPGVESA